jgi:hypothetical protein
MIADDATLAAVSTALIAIGSAVSGLEQLAARGQFARAGVYDWDLLRTTHRWTLRGRISRVLDGLFGYPQTLWIFGAQVVLGTVTLAATATTTATAGAHGRPLLAVLVGSLLALNLLGTLRCQFGLNGADQMRTVVLTGLLLFFASPTRLGQELALAFVAAQSVLSYLTSGLAKAVSPIWRSGTAVAVIVNARSYGSPRVAALLMGSRWQAIAASRGTIAFECLLPLLVFAGPWPCVAFIAAAVVFHLSIAAVMGLNDFVWSFAAALPATLHLAQSLPWV